MFNIAINHNIIKNQQKKQPQDNHHQQQQQQILIKDNYIRIQPRSNVILKKKKKIKLCLESSYDINSDKRKSICNKRVVSQSDKLSSQRAAAVISTVQDQDLETDDENNYDDEKFDDDDDNDENNNNNFKSTKQGTKTVDKKKTASAGC